MYEYRSITTFGSLIVLFPRSQCVIWNNLFPHTYLGRSSSKPRETCGTSLIITSSGSLFSNPKKKILRNVEKQRFEIPRDILSEARPPSTFRTHCPHFMRTHAPVSRETSTCWLLAAWACRCDFFYLARHMSLIVLFSSSFLLLSINLNHSPLRIMFAFIQLLVVAEAMTCLHSSCCLRSIVSRIARRRI